jgi:hypothetical protein
MEEAEENNDTMYIVVGRVTRYIEKYMAKEVELSANRKRKQKAKNDDIWKSKGGLKRKKLLINLEVRAGGTIMNPSQRQNTCSRM